MNHEEMIRKYENGEISRKVLDEYEDHLLMESRERRGMRWSQGLLGM